MDRAIWKLAVMVLIIFGVSSCASFQEYRTVYPDVCISNTQQPTADCAKHALQELPTREGNHYLLSFIEFDDQGRLWDRKQMRDVIDKLNHDASSRDLLMVVFVHGWKHNAAPGDGNINTFREVLAQLTDSENRLAKLATSLDPKHTQSSPREVVGVYLGWRGASITWPVLNQLTFWDRKNTAEKVGHGDVPEVLSRLDLIKKTKEHIEGGNSHTRLVIVGHSFGADVVSSALSQILENRFVQTTGPAGTLSDINGFADLVVLINPAFEASQFSSLSDMATERGSYFPTQLPVLLELTSEADWATRYAFPIGRWFSTLFEKTRERQRKNAVTHQEETIDEDDANITALGHFKPYRTHTLYPLNNLKRTQVKEMDSASSVKLLLTTSDKWVHDKPGSKIAFGNVMLERTKTSAGRDPYLITYVDKHLITGHNDIADPRIIDFVKQMILISTHNPKQMQTIRQLQKQEPPTKK